MTVRIGSDLSAHNQSADRQTRLEAVIAESNNDSQPHHDVLLHDTTKLLFGQKHIFRAFAARLSPAPLSDSL
jgi:hypothetical protein